MKLSMKVSQAKEIFSLVTGITFSCVPAWYESTFRDLKMDMYVPKHRDSHKPCPAIVWICGGGFMVVDRSVWMPQMLQFANAGFVVASIEYRTSNQAHFPAQLIDVKSAIRYLKAHANDLCIDPNRIFVMGESSGGTLASLIGTTSEQKAFDQGDNLEYDSSVRGVVDFYGPVIFIENSVNVSDEVPYWTIEAFLGANFSTEQAAKASAITYISHKTPPFMILHGTDDPLVPISQSDNLYVELVKNNVDVTYIVLEGAGHGDDLFFQDVIIEKILSFFDKLI